MSHVDVVEGEPEPQLVGTPAQVTVKILVNDEVVGEVRTERPNQSEAKSFCKELQREIEAIVRRDEPFLQ